MEKFDLGVVGAGPAGYTAAINAAQQGLKVVLFEKDKPGGVCLNRGCIPTKTILHSAEVFEDLNCSSYIGIFVENAAVDFSKVMEHKDKTVEKLRKSLELMLKNAGVQIVSAEAKIIDARTITANSQKYECEKIISAVGSEPCAPKGIVFDHKFILNSDDILKLKALPKSIVIVGSGAIGTEWARIFNAFGTEVTVVELSEHLLPLADVEVSKRVERIFKTKKIKFYTSTCVEKVHDGILALSNGETISPDCVLVATGRKPLTSEKVPGVKYIGDVCGEIQLAHYAIKQALCETCELLYNKDLIPSVVYGNPEIAWAGLREQDLTPGEYQKSTVLISALGKSHCDNSTDGFIKILAQNDKIAGVHIVSKEASALIHEVLIAMQNDVSVSKLKEVCFAHPTYSEGIFECLSRLQ